MQFVIGEHGTGVAVVAAGLVEGIETPLRGLRNGVGIARLKLIPGTIGSGQAPLELGDGPREIFGADGGTASKGPGKQIGVSGVVAQSLQDAVHRNGFVESMAPHFFKIGNGQQRLFFQTLRPAVPEHGGRSGIENTLLIHPIEGRIQDRRRISTDKAQHFPGIVGRSVRPQSGGIYPKRQCAPIGVALIGVVTGGTGHLAVAT